MKSKKVVPRRSAIDDADQAFDFYHRIAGIDVAIDFADTLKDAYEHIAVFPASGSPRYGVELKLDGLLTWRLKRFPYLAFYVDIQTHVDVWRILHTSRDIPAWLEER